MWRRNRQPIQQARAGRLWLVASLLFMLAAWQQPANRAIDIALGTVFGIFGMTAMRRSREPSVPN